MAPDWCDMRDMGRAQRARTVTQKGIGDRNGEHLTWTRHEQEPHDARVAGSLRLRLAIRIPHEHDALGIRRMRSKSRFERRCPRAVELFVADDEVERPLGIKGRMAFLGTMHEDNIELTVEAALDLDEPRLIVTDAQDVRITGIAVRT